MDSSSTLPSNSAVWLDQSSTLEIKPAPYTPPSTHEIVINNHAIAINPADWIKQEMGTFMFPWVKYPCMLGCDVSGEAVEIGSEVTRFKVGDRVVSLAMGLTESLNTPAFRGFYGCGWIVSERSAGTSVAIAIPETDRRDCTHLGCFH